MPGRESGKASRVRQLCRELEPIIGKRARQIWQAYLVEQEEGKAQILEYLELLTAQHFQGQLDDDVPNLHPPSREEAAGEYELGTVTYNDKPLYPFGLRESEWIQHMGIFGRSGAGKTNAGFWVIQRLIDAGKPVLIFDWKRNYRDLLEQPGFEKMAVYTIGRSASPFSFNPLIPPPQTNPKTWLKKLIAVMAHAYMLGNGVLFLLQETLDRVYEEAGVYNGSVERWPTFHDVLEKLKHRKSSGREAGWLSSALRALASLTFGDMDTLVNRSGGDLRELLERPVVLELDALTQSDKVMVIQALLLWIHHLRMADGVREQFRHAIVLEEAHHVLSGERRSLVGGQSVMELTFREIREFGESLVVLDQHPSQIAVSALGNAYTTLSFNLKHRTDVNAMAQAMLLQDDEKQVLGSLPMGQAVARLQGRGKGPFTITVPEYPIRKGAITDAHVRQHMLTLGLVSSRSGHAEDPDSDDVHNMKPRDISLPPQSPNTIDVLPSQFDREARRTTGASVPTIEAEGQKTKPGGLQSSVPAPSLPDAAHELAKHFLHDVAVYPESGVAERYKRLRLSVRQGQKLKHRLVAERFISEQLETTHTGKRRTVRLTEQGRLWIDTTGLEGDEVGMPAGA